MVNKLQLINLIEQVLGNGRKLKNDEIAFRCPFCAHRKQKLQVNLSTYKWRCWVCDNKGRSLYSLFKRLDVGKQYFDTLSDLLGDTYTNVQDSSSEEDEPILYLPHEFKSVIYSKKDPSYVRALKYLKGRGVTRGDILKHNIGFCSDGTYSGMIVIPSYDSDGILNYFVGRSIYESSFKYKNPPVSRDIIGFDLHINWKEPIVLVEGVLDALAVKRNAIPLFGKYMSKSLLLKIVKTKVPFVIIALDADAKDSVIKIGKELLKKDVRVGYVPIEENEDPSSLGFLKMNDKLRNVIELDFSVITKLKLEQGSLWKKKE